MSELTCRPAAPADLDALLLMMAEFNRGEGIAFDRNRFAPAVLKLIGDDSLGLLPVFELGGRIAGYAVLTWGFDLEFGGRDSFLTELYIDSALRGGGHGKAALAHIERLARARGAAALHLGVRPDNLPAVKLYQRAGYADWTRRFMTKLLS